ncbi:MAG: outer membrane lipoprotein carrier protein LolA [Bacteroidota bacterium]|nr:outer membrane lipoprotein carrier protein LolA [Bacteroidota bacterium]
MKIVNYFLLFFIGTIFSARTQTSVEAQNLLELTSKQMGNYENIEFEFSYILNNRVEQINQESSGQVTLAKEKYKLKFLDAIQLFDGNVLYTIVPENEEITITQADEEEEFGINPKELLNFHKDGYDYYWDINQRVKGKNIQFVKLIPKQKDGDVVSLLLGIDTQKNHLHKLIEVGKNGTVTTLTLKNMKVDSYLPENFFIFNQDDYPNYFINN